MDARSWSSRGEGGSVADDGLDRIDIWARSDAVVHWVDVVVQNPPALPEESKMEGFGQRGKGYNPASGFRNHWQKA